MNTVEASLVMSIIIFAVMYIITFCLSFTRTNNRFFKEEIVKEHKSYTINNKTFYPDEAKRIITSIDYFLNKQNKEENISE